MGFNPLKPTGAGEGEFAHNRFPLRVCEFSEGDEEFGALSGLWKPPDERYRHHWSTFRNLLRKSLSVYGFLQKPDIFSKCLRAQPGQGAPLCPADKVVGGIPP